MARKPCRTNGCPHLQPCPIDGHERKAWEGSTRRATLPSNWERLRRTVLARDELCTICGNALSTEVHHTADRNDHRLDMLAGVCKDCHRDETQQQAAAARKTR